MSIRLGLAAFALLSPDPRGLSQLLPGDELKVRDRELNFQGSAFRAGVGLGRGANSKVLGLSKGLMSGSGSGIDKGGGGAGALRRWGTGKRMEGSGRRGMSNVVPPLLVQVVCAPGGGGKGMLPSDGERRCPSVWARGRMAPSDGVRLCPRFIAMAADTCVGVRDWFGSFLKLSARRSRSGFSAGVDPACVLPVTGVSGYSSGSEGSRDLVELQSDREDRDRRVTEGEGSRQGRLES